MKAMISIVHPAWAYQFRYIINTMTKRGDTVTTLVAEKDGNTKVLKNFHIPYQLCARSTGTNFVEKGFLFLGLCIRFTWEAIKQKPDIMIGRASPMLAVAAWLTRKPHFLYEDTEVAKFSLRICKCLSTKILTPLTFLTDLGPKQERVNTYKELFYLHPNVFTPDRQALRDVGFQPDEFYVFVRFIAWNASHDIGRRGLSDEEKVAMVRCLETYGRVYVSDEGALPEALERNRLNIPYAMIHHVLAFARLVYSEGATMASEAVVLGTHALYVNTIVSGSTREQSERYHLLYNFKHEEDRYRRALEKAEELLGDPDLEKKGQEKRAKLLAEKVDINSYYISEMDRLAREGRHAKK